MMLNRRLFAVVVCAAGALALFASGAQAGVVTFETSYAFSGSAPEGTPPWLTATFDDGGSPGSVDLTLATTNLTGSEFVFEWLFNLDPLLDPNQLLFSSPSKYGNFTDPNVNVALDAFQANGDGFYDIQVEFDPFDGATRKFDAGDVVSYTITGIPTLTASSFDFLSEPDGGMGEYPTAAKVGGIGVSGLSGWVTVPEPAATGLLLLGGLLLSTRRR